MRTQLTSRVAKTVSAFALVAAASFAQANTIDFTSQAWTAAVGSGNQTATSGGVTIEAYSGAGSLTYNGGSETNGCTAGQAQHGLACYGDGIGIGNDEITEGFEEHLKVIFSSAVDIVGIDFLDLFGSEGSGETAVVVESGGVTHSFKAVAGNPLGGAGANVAGGYWASGFSATNVNSISFYAADDGYSDYALARITTKAVAVPEIDGGHASLALCLLAGLFGIFRERRLKK